MWDFFFWWRGRPTLWRDSSVVQVSVKIEEGSFLDRNPRFTLYFFSPCTFYFVLFLLLSVLSYRNPEALLYSGYFILTLIQPWSLFYVGRLNSSVAPHWQKKKRGAFRFEVFRSFLFRTFFFDFLPYKSHNFLYLVFNIWKELKVFVFSTLQL